MSNQKKSKNPKQQHIEKKLTNSGLQNPKYVDLLTEDKPISGQKFVCLSVVSPEKILKQKEVFFFEQFLKKWNFNKSMEVFVNFLQFISHKYNLTFDDLHTDFKDFIEEEKDSFLYSKLKESYDTFIDQNEEQLEKEFTKLSGFRTSVRGIKVRGSYPTQEEAELRCKMLTEIDPDHDIFVGPVGLWLPWDADPYKTERVEYSEELLNQLMHEKKKNEQNAKIAFEQRTKEAKEKAIEENIKNAEKSGNKLTQSIDENGTLIGVNNRVETLLSKSSATTSDIHAELFEGDNIITGKSDGGKSKLISGPLAK